ncbi:MAG TPA: hypothetical protein VE954_16260 [Oligoflexus sp.]|uniref:HEAT repeat domain-containing protein n=1 Tax=Oligoflexus sp. TaxID=1971216 RepID=UPI002D60EE1E|nr:hypothetical protein [Oligoflexus sp.]HYX34654.1 hypothetical protein [Oligoflexus sp.]
MKDIKEEISILYEIEQSSPSSDGLGQKQMHVLENLLRAGRKDAVVALAPLLDKKTAIMGQIRTTIIELMKLFSARDYLALDVRVRQSIWSHRLSYQPVHIIDAEQTPGEAALLLYGLYSMHRSGYVREKAVRALSHYDSAKVLPFLLLRINDWVPQVSTLASEILERTLKRGGYQVELISSLPLVDHIRAYGRGDISRHVSMIEGQICKDASLEELIEGMQSPIREVRRALVKLLPQNERNMDLALKALDDSDPIVRSLAFQKVTTNEYLSWETIRALCKSKYADQRRLAYAYLAKVSHSDVRKTFLGGLLDRSAGVRSVCQYFLARKFQYDPVRYYTELLPEPVALLGLGETDPKGSASRIVDLLKGSSEPRVERAALITLGKVDPDAYWEIFVLKAKTANLGVAIQALKQLLRCGRLAPDLLMELHSQHDEPLRRVIIRLARKLSKWPALSTLLQLYIQEDSVENKQMIVDFLSFAAGQPKRVFTSPTRVQSSVIRSNLPLIDMLSSDMKNEIFMDLKEFEKKF